MKLKKKVKKRKEKKCSYFTIYIYSKAGAFHSSFVVSLGY
jgi:hypothetical protein